MLELALRGEQFDLVAIGDLHRGERGVAVEILDRTVLAARAVVGFDLWQRVGFRVGGSEVKSLALERGPDRPVADRGHLFELLQFVRVVDRAEGAVAATEDVDAVGDLVVLVPQPVFLAHRCEDSVVLPAVRGGFPKQGICQNWCELRVAALSQQGAVARQRLLAVVEPRLCDGEQIDERHALGGGDVFHGGGVEREVRVGDRAIGRAVRCRQVLERDRRYQRQARGRLAIVFLRCRVADEIAQLQLEAVEPGHAAERFVVAEKRHDRIWFEPRQPLVGRLVLANSGVPRSPAVFGIRSRRVVFLRPGKRPRRRSRRMRAETWRVALVAQVADENPLARMAALHLGFEESEVHQARAEPIAEQHEPRVSTQLERFRRHRDTSDEESAGECGENTKWSRMLSWFHRGGEIVPSISEESSSSA